MQTEQRESGHIVFESNLPGPAIFVMAFFTTFAFLSPVNIIRAVTTEALCFKLFLVYLTFMTG